MLPAVMHAVCGPLPPPQAATLTGYARYRLHDRVFPGIVPAAGAITEGVVYEGLDAGLWRRLDEFESDLYQRLAVTITMAGAQTLAACAYVLPAHLRHRLSAEPWSPTEFAARHLADYLTRYTAARA